MSNMTVWKRLSKNLESFKNKIRTMTRTSGKSITERLETMSSKEFVEQPPDYFDRLFREALKKADLTVKERKRKWKKYQ